MAYQIRRGYFSQILFPTWGLNKEDFEPCGKQHFRDLPTPDWTSPFTKTTYFLV